MKNDKTSHVSHSVLNTDAFDKRRFREIFEMSQGLQKVRAQSILPEIGPLLGDIWASLYKMKPEIKSDVVKEAFKLNKSLMKIIMMNENFGTYRNLTRLDDFTSAVATVKIGGKINQWLVDEIEKDRNARDELGHDFSAKLIEIENKLEKVLDSNNHAISNELDQAIQETIEMKSDVISLIGGQRAGSGKAELKKVPLRDQLLLAEKLTVNKKMKEIAEWAGRFKQITRKKKQTKYDESVDLSNVTFGNEIDKLLSVEFSLYMHSATKIDFLRRFVEKKTMQYEVKSRETLGKGPIILCLDQSGSMQHLDTQAKGFALALMLIARKQKRDFCLILFSTSLEIYKYRKGKINSADLVNVATTFLGGGTNYKLSLEAALTIINESRYKNADVIYVTDGEGDVSDSFIKSFNKNKRRDGFNVLSLIVGEGSEMVKSFSDKVINMKDLNEKGSYAALEL